MQISEQLQLEVVVKDPAFERILVPLDGSRSAERVLEKHGSNARVCIGAQARVLLGDRLLDLQ